MWTKKSIVVYLPTRQFDEAKSGALHVTASPLV